MPLNACHRRAATGRGHLIGFLCCECLGYTEIKRDAQNHCDCSHILCCGCDPVQRYHAISCWNCQHRTEVMEGCVPIPCKNCLYPLDSSGVWEERMVAAGRWEQFEW